MLDTTPPSIPRAGNPRPVFVTTCGRAVGPWGHAEQGGDNRRGRHGTGQAREQEKFLFLFSECALFFWRKRVARGNTLSLLELALPGPVAASLRGVMLLLLLAAGGGPLRC